MENQENQNILNLTDQQIKDFLALSNLQLQRIIELRNEELKAEEQRKQEKLNPPFAQIYKGTGTKALQWLMKKSPLAAQIFMFFLEHMNNQNAVVASQQLLMEEFEKGRTSIYNAIKLLEEHNFINIAKIGTGNVYILNPELVFQSSNDKKKYISFNGTVLLSKEENKKLFEKYNYDNIKVLHNKKGE